MRCRDDVGCLTCWQVCPTDHELCAGLARVLALLGEHEAAKATFLAASEIYPHCPLSHSGLGTLLLAEGRPRAALRAYERALANCAETDVDAGWDASVKGPSPGG